MNFHFEGLDVPLTLPDDYLSVRMYENLQAFAQSHPETEGQMRYVREALAAMLAGCGKSPSAGADLGF